MKPKKAAQDMISGGLSSNELKNKKLERPAFESLGVGSAASVLTVLWSVGLKAIYYLILTVESPPLPLKSLKFFNSGVRKLDCQWLILIVIVFPFHLSVTLKLPLLMLTS